MKKMICAILAITLIFAMGATAFAASWVELRVLDKKVENANERIDRYVLTAKLTPWDDVRWLLKQVDNAVKPVMKYADRIGVTVICEYESHFVDGRWVEIDPLRVVH